MIYLDRQGEYRRVFPFLDIINIVKEKLRSDNMLITD